MNKTRMTCRGFALATLIGTALFSAYAYAEKGLGAHVHGVATLLIALEGNKLELEFHSPAVNFLGFEHEAHSKAEKEAVNTLEKRLSKFENSLKLNGGACSLSAANVDVSGLISDEHHDHEKHVHKHDHDKHNHDKHEHAEKKSRKASNQERLLLTRT